MLRADQAQVHIAAAEAVLGGTVDVSGPVGGTVAVEATRIALDDTLRINATGTNGGGNVLIGGDWQGGTNAERRVFADADAIRQAQEVTMASGAVINASATESGDGGTVVLWSDVGDEASVTRVAGEIRANGGAAGGDGGSIETSGHKLFTAGATGSASATVGRAGEWLFDPTNITVTNDTSTGGGVAGSTVTSGAIASLLGAGTNVTLLSDTNLTWNANAVVSVAPTSPVTLALQSKGLAVSTMSFGAGSKVESTGSPLSFSIAMRTQQQTMSSSVDLSGLTVNTKGGNFSVTGASLTGTGSAIYLNGSTLINTGAGNISLTGEATNGLVLSLSHGIRIDGATLTTTNGNITIDGKLGGTLSLLDNGSRAILVSPGTTMTTTGSGYIDFEANTITGNPSSTAYLLEISGTAKNTKVHSGGNLRIYAFANGGGGSALLTKDVDLSSVGNTTIYGAEIGGSTQSYVIDSTNISSTQGKVDINVFNSDLYMVNTSQITTGTGKDVVFQVN